MGVNRQCWKGDCWLSAAGCLDYQASEMLAFMNPEFGSSSSEKALALVIVVTVGLSFVCKASLLFHVGLMSCACVCYL